MSERYYTKKVKTLLEDIEIIDRKMKQERRCSKPWLELNKDFSRKTSSLVFSRQYLREAQLEARRAKI